jgi:hypothetical protein
MTKQEFEKVYESSQQKALTAIYRHGIKDHGIAEDAVQSAAMFFLERLDTHTHITTSLFVQRAVQRAKSLLESYYGSDRPNAKQRREIGIGGLSDLAEFEEAQSGPTVDGDC